VVSVVEEHQPRFAVDEVEEPAARLRLVEIPVGQNPALGQLAVDEKDMRARPVRVTVDHPLYLRRPQRLGDGVMTVGIPIGFGVIVFTIVITAIYVKRANGEFDDLNDAVSKAVLK